MIQFMSTKRKITTIILVFLISYSPISAENMFWGKNGHRAVGKIAEKYLTKKTKKKIHALLDGRGLDYVSTYADEIKSDRRYDSLYTWHYVNFPFDSKYEDSDKNPSGDLISGIEFCIKTIKDPNASKDDKAFYLRMLVHFIGDLHQPLHVGRAEDRGGNDIEVTWFGRPTNLHRVWDENMIAEYNMSFTELAENTKDLSDGELQNIQRGNIMDWIYESQELSKIVYASAQSGDDLRYRYMYDYFGTLHSQLQKGGIRLAKVLNEIL